MPDPPICDPDTFYLPELRVAGIDDNPTEPSPSCGADDCAGRHCVVPRIDDLDVSRWWVDGATECAIQPWAEGTKVRFTSSVLPPVEWALALAARTPELHVRMVSLSPQMGLGVHVGHWEAGKPLVVQTACRCCNGDASLHGFEAELR